MQLTVDSGQLPVGWEIKKLGDVCHVIGGGTPSKSNEEFYTGEIPWATVRDMKNEIISETECRITEEAVKKSSTNIIKKGNVVIATRVGLGKVCVVAQDTAINQDLRGIIPKNTNQILVKFLFWWLKSIAHLIKEEGTGVTVQGVKVTFVNSLKIPIPPLTEQKRIVAILDEAFEGIDRAIANTEKNLANSRELFKSILKSQFSSIKNDWINTTIGKQITLQRGFDITKKLQNSGNIPVVSSGGIKSFHNIAMAKAPGVVIGRKGTLGKVFYLDKDFWPHDTTLWVKDFNKNYPKFVYYFFQTLDVIKLDTGTANPALNRNLIHPIKVNWPPICQQEEITKKLDFSFAETQRLETIYRQKIAALNELKQSILQKAFTGELTAATPKTAKQEIAA